MAVAVNIAYLPAGHAVQAVAPAAEYEPAAQATYVAADNPTTVLKYPRRGRAVELK